MKPNNGEGRTSNLQSHSKTKMLQGEHDSSNPRHQKKRKRGQATWWIIIACKSEKDIKRYERKLTCLHCSFHFFPSCKTWHTNITTMSTWIVMKGKEEKLNPLPLQFHFDKNAVLANKRSTPYIKKDLQSICHYPSYLARKSRVYYLNKN